MVAFVGFDPSVTVTSAERITSGKGFAPGNFAVDYAGNEWLYVLAGAACPQNNVIRVLASGNIATPLGSAGLGGTAGAIKTLAVTASASIASGSFGWVMTKGRAAVKCCASSTGTFVPTGTLSGCVSANAGLVQSTASGLSRALTGMVVETTATTSTTASTIPVVFYDGIVTTA